MPSIVNRSGITPTNAPKKQEQSTEEVAIELDDNIEVHDITESVEENKEATITEEEAHEVYQAVSEADPETDLADAITMTGNTAYTDLEVIDGSVITTGLTNTENPIYHADFASGPDTTTYAKVEADQTDETVKVIDIATEGTESEVDNTDDSIPTISDEEAKEMYDSIDTSDEAIKEAFSGYGITDEECLVMLDLLREYQETKSVKGLYEKLPKALKVTVDQLVMQSGVHREQLKVARKNVVTMLMDNFINDAKFNQIVNEYKTESNKIITEMNKGYNDLFKDAINETFDKIEEIRTEDPERAARIEGVKKAFDDALKLTVEKEFITHISRNKLNKYKSRFSNEAYYLNNRLKDSNTSMNLPKIEDLYEGLRLVLPDDAYSDDDIALFLTTICRAHMKDDYTNNINHLAYMYRLLSTIYAYRFIDLYNDMDESTTAVINNIKEVLDKIKSL